MKRILTIAAFVVTMVIATLADTLSAGSANWPDRSYTKTGGSQAALSDQAQGSWIDHGFYLDGLDGGASALTEYNGSLIVSGSFTRVNQMAAAGVVAWNGTDWSLLGSGIHGSIMAAAVYGSELIVAGSLDSAGSGAVANIAAWNGTNWHALGQGIRSANAQVFALAVYKGKLIAGGIFDTAGTIAAHNVAAWDGIAWNALNSPFGWDYEATYALSVFNNKLIVGGSWAFAGFLKTWDGTAWSPTTGLDGDVRAFTTWNGKLIVGGAFHHAGDGTPAEHIAAWDGASWLSLGSQLDMSVGALFVYQLKLLVGTGSSVFAYEGGLWTTFTSDPGIAGFPFALYQNKLICQRNAVPACGVRAVLVSWNDTSWTAIGARSRLCCRGGPLVPYGTKLIVGGSVTNQDNQVVTNGIASWDGNTWTLLGAGIDGSANALVVFEGKLICAGGFSSAGGIPARNIAAWDGSSWASLDSGLAGQVNALVVFNDKLIVGGEFTSGVAAWDGSSWAPLEQGVNGHVDALTVFDGKLIAGGNFTSAGAIPADCVASFNGSVWSPLGAGMSGYDFSSVDALVVYNGRLIAGHNYSQSYVRHGRVAEWDGSAWWQPLGQFASVWALSVYNNKLIAAGDDLMAYDGSSWSGLGGGVNDDVYWMTVYGTGLFVSGPFTVAGGKVSAFLAEWNEAATDVIDINGSDLPREFTLEQNYPNPFNPTTTIEFSIPRPAFVTLDIYDVLGRRVATLVNERLQAGAKRASWDGKDNKGHEVASGVYLYKLMAGEYTESRKMLLLK